MKKQYRKRLTTAFAAVMALMTSGASSSRFMYILKASNLKCLHPG